MTNPAADAAKLLPCPCGGEHSWAGTNDLVRCLKCGAEKLLSCHDNEWHAVGPGTPLNVWLETKRDGEDGANVCFCRLLSIGDEPEWIEQPPYGRTTVTHHSFAPPTHWRWNTRPQPAPPAGEPDFMRDAETFARKENAPFGVERLLRQFGERMYRLGLAARPKVEDGILPKGLVEALRHQRQIDEDGEEVAVNRQACDEAADLLERLAGELAEVMVDRDEWKQQHENLVGVRATDIANLAAKIDDLKRELDRRKGDPRTRLHNLCEALQEDLNKSPYTREEWEQVDRETVELQCKLREAEAKLAEREAGLERADNLILWVNKWVGGLHAHGNMAEEIVVKISEYYAARQQQKASAEEKSNG